MKLLIKFMLVMWVLQLVTAAMFLVFFAVTSAGLGDGVPVARYGSCAELRTDFPTGLARTQELADAITTDPAAAPRVWPPAVRLNGHLDANGNGVICAMTARQ